VVALWQLDDRQIKAPFGVFHSYLFVRLPLSLRVKVDVRTAMLTRD
jgi:hypothetical protein